MIDKWTVRWGEDPRCAYCWRSVSTTRVQVWWVRVWVYRVIRAVDCVYRLLFHDTLLWFHSSRWSIKTGSRDFTKPVRSERRSKGLICGDPLIYDTGQSNQTLWSHCLASVQPVYDLILSHFIVAFTLRPAIITIVLSGKTVVVLGSHQCPPEEDHICTDQHQI